MDRIELIKGLRRWTAGPWPARRDVTFDDAKLFYAAVCALETDADEIDRLKAALVERDATCARQAEQLKVAILTTPRCAAAAEGSGVRCELSEGHAGPHVAWAGLAEPTQPQMDGTGKLLFAHPEAVHLWLRQEPEGHFTLLLECLGTPRHALGLVHLTSDKEPDKNDLTCLAQDYASTIGAAIFKAWQQRVA